MVAIWSLVIYYWAMAVALPTEQIEEMVREVVDCPRKRAWRCRRH